jgi:predicted aldo/keto reductase-like oxidoreductase
MGAIETLKKEKKIRFCGVSTHSDMARVLNEAAKSGFYDVILTSINFTMSKDKDLLDAIKNAAEKGVGIIAMKTQASGRRYKDNKDTEKMNQTAALKWVLRNENITTAIPGYTNYDHMEEDFSVALNLELTPEEKDFLTNRNVLFGVGFCIQCSKCLSNCPYGVDIPHLMRTHMYAAQYNNFYQARATLDDIPEGSGLDNCKNCTNCNAKCVRAINIPKRIDELKVIYA